MILRTSRRTYSNSKRSTEHEQSQANMAEGHGQGSE